MYPCSSNTLIKGGLYQKTAQLWHKLNMAGYQRLKTSLDNGKYCPKFHPTEISRRLLISTGPVKTGPVGTSFSRIGIMACNIRA
jgi:hypothetical protein